MILSFAPMEGVTSPVFRRVHARLFPGADKYYTPFIAPDRSGDFKNTLLRGMLPENNVGVPLVPQILANDAEAFLHVARQAADLGYREVNLNLGCPSATVVAKHKGSGLLRDPAALDAFLADLFSRVPLAVSIKSRLGFSSTEEIDALMEIYRRYPIHELILHARHREGFYKSEPDYDAFSRALTAAPFPVVYNGNVFTPADYRELCRRFPDLDALMLGRGAAANGALFRMLRGGEPLRLDELRAFHAALSEEYRASGLSPAFAASRMKEHWYYMISLFSDCARPYKALLKSRDLRELNERAETLFSSCPFDGSAGFRPPK